MDRHVLILLCVCLCVVVYVNFGVDVNIKGDSQNTFGAVVCMCVFVYDSRALKVLIFPHVCIYIYKCINAHQVIIK